MMNHINSTGKAFIGAGVILFVFTFISPGMAQRARAPGPEWDLAADFRVFPGQENPNRDSFGNTDVWYFLESAPHTFPAHIPSTYTLLPEFINDAFFIVGLEKWQGSVVSNGIKDKLPHVGINNTGATQFPRSMVWPAGVMEVHPLPNEFAIVGWRSPFNGSVAVTGGVTDLDNNCGNGILWFIDRFDGVANTTLASGSILNGGAQNFEDGPGGINLTDVIVNEGDFLYFLVDAKLMEHRCDSTGLALIIRPTAIEALIDIKPGSFSNSINPNNRGVIPVAILTTATFDATQVDPAMVRFGTSGTEAPVAHSAFEDVDGDGDIDLIFHFHTQATGIKCGDTSAALTGETFGGQAIRGTDFIKTVGCNVKRFTKMTHPKKTG